MLIASKPFGINDRIALINWQYGKFPPSLSHGWLEPAYTGYVKEITLIYTKIMTDSNMLITVPNGVAMQCLILNHNHDRTQSYIAAQLEVPIIVNPDELQKNLNAELSKITAFSGKEENFEILEVSPTSYLVTLLYRIEAKKERRNENPPIQSLQNRTPESLAWKNNEGFIAHKYRIAKGNKVSRQNLKIRVLR